MRGKIPYLTSSELSVHPAPHQIIIIVGINKIRSLNDKGRNLFHVRFIRWSYRIRGKEARIQTNRVAKINVSHNIVRSLINDIGTPKKMILENNLITKIFAYSAMKIRANNPLLYSTLNPETSSDSPSAKSNGVRLVSARLVINQTTANGIHRVAIQVIVVALVKSIVINIIRADSRTRDILTS